MTPTEAKREAAAISPSDPAVIIAGIRQFGVAPDGSDLRDLEAAFARLTAAIPLPEPSSVEWQMVPREPTEAMLATWPHGMNDKYRLREFYRAMLSASPAPDGEGKDIEAVAEEIAGQLSSAIRSPTGGRVAWSHSDKEVIATALRARDKATTARTAELEGALNAISRAFETPEHLRDIARSALASGSRT